MGNFSRDTFDKLKHYVGVRLQQGVPLVDADWNEQEDIRRYELQAFLKWFVGNGVPEGNDGFRILSHSRRSENDFIIKGGDDKGAGRCLVEGWDVVNEKDLGYIKQPLYDNDVLAEKWEVDPVKPLTTPTTDRTDTVFLDVWEREVDYKEDDNLFNSDIGLETCVRLKREWVVRVAQATEETKLDAPPAGHVYYPLATLKRVDDKAAIDQEDIKDLRRTGVAVSPEEITIKDGNVGIGTLTPQNKLQLGGGDIAIGDNKHRAGKIRLWQEPNNKDDCVSHAIGTEAHYNIYGAGKEYANSIGHRFYRGGEELIAQIGVGGNGKPYNRLNSYFAGNVGIGTTSPTKKLDVNTDTDHDGIYLNDVDGTTKGRLLRAPGGWAYFQLNDAAGINKVQLNSKGNSYFNGGNVGIGTPSPTKKLDVNTDTDYDGIYLNDVDGTTKGRLLRAPGGWAYFQLNDAAGIKNVQLNSKGNSYFNGGNVGIGTSIPKTILHVRSNSDDNSIVTIQGPVGSDISHDTGGILRWTAGGGYTKDFGVEAFLDRDARALTFRSIEDVKNTFDNILVIERRTGCVGIGTDNPAGYKLYVDGHFYSSGGLDTKKGDYAEYFESADGSAIPVGTSVPLTKDGKVTPSKKGEIPIGIITTNAAIVGNSYKEWPKKYLRDEFGNLIMEEYREELTVPKKEKVTRERQKVEKKTITEEVTRTEIVFETGKYIQKEISGMITREVEEPLFEEVDLYDATGKNVIGKHRIPIMETYEEEIEVLDGNGQPVLAETGEFVTKQRPKLNPEHDESKKYVSREDRPEWNCVGLLGQLPLRKGQPVAPTWIKIKDISKEVELWLVR